MLALALSGCEALRPGIPVVVGRWALRSSVVDSSSTNPVSSWQEDVDSALDIDASCEKRQETLRGLLQSSEKREAILKDVQAALRETDVEARLGKVSAGKTKKALLGLEEFRKQLITDILPSLPQTLLQQTQQAKPLTPPSPKDVQGLVEQLRDIAQDPIALQSTTEEVRREFKNIFRSTPLGLDSPKYDVVRVGNGFEMRSYSGYSVVQAKAGGGASVVGDVAASGRLFNTLASFIFGENKDKSKLSMTTPVITTQDYMAFPLPSGVTAADAPKPLEASGVEVKDVPATTVAAREFSGIATQAEVAKQRALLEDALLFEGIQADNLSLTVLQYNSPLTLPWLRRNEVLLTVLAT